MPLKGGASDKFGIRYEGRWTVFNMADVMDELASAIRLEPHAVEDEEAEFWVRRARLALAGYEALTIMTLMGHKDLKTTMRYIRAVQLQRNVRSQNFGHKSPTQTERPPVLAAVSC